MTSKVEDVIWMIWKNDQGQPFKVGQLSKGAEKYYFEYDIDGVKRAEEYGFAPLETFPIVDAKYFREELFYSFSSNLPGYGEKDITSVLKKYSIKEYDDFELLKKSGGQTSTGSFEFISPFEEMGEEIEEEIEEIEEEIEQIVLDEK